MQGVACLRMHFQEGKPDGTVRGVQYTTGNVNGTEENKHREAANKSFGFITDAG